MKVEKGEGVSIMGNVKREKLESRGCAKKKHDL